MQGIVWILSAAIFLLAASTLFLFIYSRSAAKRIKLLEHTAALIESAPYYIAYDDNESSDLYANAEAYRLVGRPAGRPMTKESTHDERGMRLLLEEAFPAVEKYGTWVGENQLLHNDGHLIDVQQFIFPVKDKNGRNLGMGTLMRDITAEKAMRHGYDLQLALLDSSNNFVVALDMDNQVIFANPGVYEMSGYSRQELGLHFSPEIFHEPETCRLIRETWKTALEKGVCEMESEFIRKDGTRLEVTHKAFVIKDAKGRAMGIGAILNDISELKAAQRNLVHARDAAEAANRAKSAFLSNMSHEIRTPMNAIIGMTCIAKMCDDLPKIRESLSKVEASSEHLLAIINDILDLSKIESGKLEIYQKDFQVQKVFENILGIIGVKAEEKRLRLSADIASNTPNDLYGDANRLSQVIMNLLSNAVKFTPEGGEITLNAKSECLADGELRLDIAVRDSGIGMTAEQQSRLFIPFEQTDSSITARFGGTGLGLAISKRLVEMMGGSISVESASGQGSCFRFYVICRQAEISQEREVANNDSAASTDFGSHTILLAEDIEINREILKTLLASTHVTIEEARDGLEAVEMFTAHPDRYDLIFMDLQMPRMNGYAATREIRQSSAPNAQTVPIIAMTADAFAEDVKSCLDAGMNGHISKPINIAQVIAQMQEHCRQ